MTHAPKFWREYVRSASDGDTDRIAMFDRLIADGFSGGSAAYKAMEGRMYAHNHALKEAHEVVRQNQRRQHNA